MRKTSYMAILLSMAVLLSSCTKNPFVVVNSNCPAVAVTGNTGTLTRFRGEGRNADDITLEAWITGLSVVCNEDDSRGIQQEVKFAILARRAPDSGIDSVTLPYFVVLMRDNNLITTKRIYEATINFPAGGMRAGTEETIIQSLDDIETARRYDYELLIGFQLTPDEASYNILR